MMDFRKIKVWDKSHRFVLEVYELTKAFPKEEIFGLTSQLRRAAVSIPNNIAEGCGRSTESDLNRFLTISMGSASEVDYLLLLSKDLDYISQSQFNDINAKVIEIKKMLSAYSARIRQNS